MLHLYQRSEINENFVRVDNKLIILKLSTKKVISLFMAELRVMYVLLSKQNNTG